LKKIEKKQNNFMNSRYILRGGSKIKTQISQKFWEYYLENRQAVYIYALSLTNNENDAKDIIQETFVRLVRTFQNRDELPEKFGAYFFKCLRRAGYDFFKSNKRPPMSILEFHTRQMPERDIIKYRLIEECLNRLQSREREIVILKAVLGMTYSEIAEIMNQSEWSVRSNYMAALAQMREMLEGVRS